MLLCLSMLVASGSVFAASPPDEVIKQTSQQMIDALKEKHDALEKNPELIYDLIEAIVVPHFDIGYIVRLVLGKYWRQASPQQQSAFTDAFRTFVLDNYAKALLQYADEKITVFPVSTAALKSQRLTVRSLVYAGGAEPLKVNYRMHMKDGEWKVIDFTVDGISLIINYKNSFSDQIRKTGLDALIELIIAKNDSFTL